MFSKLASQVLDSGHGLEIKNAGFTIFSQPAPNSWAISYFFLPTPLQVQIFADLRNKYSVKFELLLILDHNI